MSQNLEFNLFSEKEQKAQSKFKAWKDNLFGPLGVWFYQKGIQPEVISYLGVICVIIFCILFGIHPGISIFFLVFQIILDNVDGLVARTNKIQSIRGSFIDFCCDHLSLFLIGLTFIYHNFVSPFWMSIYLINYLILIIFILISKFHRIKIFLITKTKYPLYFMFLIWLLTGHNYLNPFLIFFSVYMGISNLFLYQKIKCSL